MPKADGKTPKERFKERYEVDPVTGCWNWTAGTNSNGYAYLFSGVKRRDPTLQAYKLAWTWKNGPVPPRMELHHTCNNNQCVNPDHLQLLTRRDHALKGNNPAAQNARKTECLRGHPFTPENTYTNPSGERICRACQKLRRSKRKAG